MITARGLALAAACMLTLSSGCASRSSAPIATPASSTLGEAFLSRFSSTDHLALWSVRLERAGTRDVVASYQDRRAMVPASNMKIVTLAAAATRLGWDYRFRTRVHATGSRDGHVLDGDLVVVGGADPTLGAGDDPLAPFRAWARQLRAQGIQRIEGDLVGDASRFGEAWLGDSWSWDDLAYYYSAAYSGLTFHENIVRVRLTPGAVPGDAPRVTLTPAHVPDIRVDATTGDAGMASSLDVSRDVTSPVVHVTGTVPAGGATAEVRAAVADPAMYFLGALRDVFASEGIEIRGRTRVARTTDDVLGPALIVHESAPLSVVAQRFMKVSQNLYGEIFLRVLAAQRTSDLSSASVRAQLQEALQELGVPAGAVQGLDGSGLSRRDFATSQAIIALLTRMAEPPHGEVFRATLPVAGRDGTLASRFADSPCSDRLLAKTGSLAHVRALSGYITSASGTPYVFSVIANNYLAPTAEIDRITDDALALVCAS